MKEILQAVKEMQKDPSVKGGETALMIPSLERLVNVSLLSFELFGLVEVTYRVLFVLTAPVLNISCYMFKIPPKILKTQIKLTNESKIHLD